MLADQEKNIQSVNESNPDEKSDDEIYQYLKGLKSDNDSDKMLKASRF